MMRATLAIVLALAAGCASTAGEDAAADAADPGADGKADGLRFTFGLYAGELEPPPGIRPLSIALYGRSGDYPLGESGWFDLVRLDGNATYLDRGTFKLYTWDGHERIRFTSDAGEIIYRADWRFDNGTLVLDDNALAPIPPSGTMLDCIATELLDPTVFGPLLDPRDNMRITIQPSATGFVLNLGERVLEDAMYIESDGAVEVIAPRGAEDVILWHRANVPRRGEVRQTRAGDVPRDIARIACR